MDNEDLSKTAFPYHAARWSWLTLVIGAIFMSVGNSLGGGLAGDMIMLIAIAAGFILGVIALFGIPHYGQKGILVPAMIGIILCSLMAFIFVTNFVEARNRVRAARSTLQR